MGRELRAVRNKKASPTRFPPLVAPLFLANEVLLDQDFHFGILNAQHYTLKPFRSCPFLFLSGSNGLKRGESRPFRIKKNQKTPYFEAITQTPVLLSP